MGAKARRWRQPVVLSGVVGLLAVPVLIDSDDFPLSTYPMYSRTRPAEVDFVTAHGVSDDGAIVALGLRVIGASDDPLVVAGELRAAVRAGRAGERCAEIRDRLLDERADSASWDIRVVTERHDVIAHTADRPSLLGRTVHAECGAVR